MTPVWAVFLELVAVTVGDEGGGVAARVGDAGGAVEAVVAGGGEAIVGIGQGDQAVEGIVATQPLATVEGGVIGGLVVGGCGIRMRDGAGEVALRVVVMFVNGFVGGVQFLPEPTEVVELAVDGLGGGRFVLL